MPQNITQGGSFQAKGLKGASLNHFKPINLQVNFPQLEKDILKSWEDTNLQGKYLQKNSKSTKRFSFLDGPITANNPMGVHHAWGRTYKDLWQRYYNMKGYKQRFQNGFDCQGLWVEVEVEKELGLHSKKDIENLVPGDKKASIAKFVGLCRERVFKYANIQSQQSQRLGYFMDWENSYFTLSEANNYMIWHFLKKCHERGLVYKGHDSVPWCPRCGTAISQHEMLTEDYKEIVHKAIYVAFPVDGQKDEHILIWTTTPWTIPANIAAAINPDLKYVLAQAGEKKYYLTEQKAKELDLKIVKKVNSKDLVGLTYQAPFDDLPKVKKALKGYKHTVVETDERILPVTQAEGTGIVHVATGAGTEDFALGKKLKLPVVDIIDEEANYLDDLGMFSGQNAKKHPEIIIDYLNEKGFLLKSENYKHRYPACWRCKSELVWRVVDEWYISMDEDKSAKSLRNQMKSVAKKINWIPKFGLKRELDWLNNMHDWLISKKRYWGLALPIWTCSKCDHFEVIGSRDELQKKASKGWENFEGNTPHRPWIDEIKLTCDKCSSEMSRVPDVGNPWLDAGIVAYSTISEDNLASTPDHPQEEPLYKKDKKAWQKWFPADFITESFPGQFKNWFYSLIAMSTVLENKPPFKTVLGFGTLLAEDGHPMHKSAGNAIEFNEGADKIGVDVMRWMYLSQNPADNLLFGYRVADETRRQFHLKLWNIYNFFVTYASLDNWLPSNNLLPSPNNVLDKWILSRLAQTEAQVSTSLSSFDAVTAANQVSGFVDDLSNWYVRRSRNRVGLTAENTNDKQDCHSTLYYNLVTLSQILAPFIPYMSEEIYKNLTGAESVHLSDWPQIPNKLVDKDLEDQMVSIRQIAELAHSERKTQSPPIPVHQPLNSLASVSTYTSPGPDVLKLLQEEVNVKNITWEKGSSPKVKLDTTITPDLAEESRARELLRNIQTLRREQGMALTDTISVVSDWLPTNQKLLDQIKKKALITQIKQGKSLIVTKNE